MFSPNFNEDSYMMLFLKIILFCIFIQTTNYLFISQRLCKESLLLALKKRQLKEIVMQKQKEINLFSHEEMLIKVKEQLKKSVAAKMNLLKFSRFLDLVYLAGLKEYLSFELFNPDANYKNSFYNKRTITINLVGEYSRIIAFLYKINSLPYYIDTSKLSLLTLKDSQLLRLKLKLSLYNFPSSIVESTQLDKLIDKQGRYYKSSSFKKIPNYSFIPSPKNPFKLTERQFKENERPLVSFSLNKIKFHGFLKTENQFWALLGPSNNDLVHIKLGDYFGKANAKFIAIGEDYIKVKYKIYQNGALVNKILKLRLRGPND